MRSVGTVVRGIRTPIIKEGDNLKDIVVNSLFEAAKSENFEFRDKDVIAITEAIVSISQGNYATTDDVATDIRNKFKNGIVGVLFPTPVSRNRFEPYLRGIARGTDKIIMQLSYPGDEVGNKLFNEDFLEEYGINPGIDVLNEEEYNKYFGGSKHEFTGVDYIEYFRKVVEAENCDIEYVFANDPKEILKYTKDVLICTVHSRNSVKKILERAGGETLYKLDEILSESINGSGYNPKYGLLGSNRATDERLKLFPKDGQPLIEEVQVEMKSKTGKDVEVMIFADGAFKDPVCGIWELADPVVSPFYTKGLDRVPNEIKLKYIADNKYCNLSGEELNEAIKSEIRAKEESLIGKAESLGTTPRRVTDLIGSLCDLTSGSGDKGTPVVLVQGYFDNYAD